MPGASKADFQDEKAEGERRGIVGHKKSPKKKLRCHPAPGHTGVPQFPAQNHSSMVTPVIPHSRPSWGMRRKLVRKVLVVVDDDPPPPREEGVALLPPWRGSSFLAVLGGCSEENLPLLLSLPQV